MLIFHSYVSLAEGNVNVTRVTSHENAEMM